MLNDRIKELRQAKRMTQVDLAKSLGLTKQCVSNWENDNVLPSVEMLSRLADFFGVSTDYLLCRDEGHTLNVGGLSPVEIAHVQEIVSDLKKRKI
ncbi:MAG: helix-turn-helix transcriptional regulator [Candidatus Borkfalkiaceae bacterium]|nr:helix-turn-helix transcriptional regulator [Christensenellaceae bacterium]